MIHFVNIRPRTRAVRKGFPLFVVRLFGRIGFVLIKLIELLSMDKCDEMPFFNVV